MLNLRPCPFCGIAPKVEHNQYPYSYTVIIFCDNNECSAGPIVTGGMMLYLGRRADVRLAEQRAAYAWNGPEAEVESDRAIVEGYELRGVSLDYHESRGGR